MPESFISIDKYRLDHEWENQPGLFLKYADTLAEAEADEIEAKAEMELVEAEVNAEVNSNPRDYGIEGRVTKDKVKATVLRSREYQTAQKAYHNAIRRAKHLKAAVRALEHRKSALENEVYLHGQGYFAEKPKSRLAKMGGREAMRDSRKRAVRTPLRGKHDDD